MKLSKSFSTTLRDAPAGTEAESHKLLLRAGFIRQIGQGLFATLPLGKRAVARIENIIREEMNEIGGQELSMPVVHPAEIWKQSGRWQVVGPEMARFKDRKDRDMVLAMTHEEIVGFLAATEIKSYRQLPQMIYHLQTKFRDDPRPRAGLIRVREFTMKDSYTLDLDDAGLDLQYRAHYSAYFKIYQRCSLPTIAVGSDVGMMGGSLAHEYMYITPIGEDTLVLCTKCDYAANKQIAAFAKPAAPHEPARAMEKVATPECKTIDELAAMLHVHASHTAKAVFFTGGKEGDLTSTRFIFAVVRGDMQVNETKITNALGIDWLQPATEAEILATGAVPGYASPIGLPAADKSGGRMPVVVIVDDAVPTSPNLVAGANETGFHLLNTNCPRDYAPDVVADIAAAGDGDACVRCGSPLATVRGVEVGNIFKLGTRYSKSFGATYLDQSGVPQPIVMGSYGIGVGRLLACIAEEHHDERGLIWPVSVTPFEVHLVSLNTKDAAVTAVAERIYSRLSDSDISVVWDDRDETPGVKFADADLMGMPLRMTVSAKSIGKGGVEFKRRDRPEFEIVSEENLIGHITTVLGGMREDLRGQIQSKSL